MRAGSEAVRAGLDEGDARMIAQARASHRTSAAAPPRVALIDHGAGNLVSIEQGLLAAGAHVVRALEPRALSGVDAIVLPGVGAPAPAMARLRRRGLVDPIRRWVEDRRPFLGICLGLQLLFEGSDEDGAETLGMFSGRSERLEDAPSLPHIGWNQVEAVRPDRLLEPLPAGADVYFVHSYAVRPGPSAAAEVIARTRHGVDFVSAFGVGDVYGVQFHPERSGRHGLALLRAFVQIAAERSPGARRERMTTLARRLATSVTA
ncbi:MAG TPA: imidazole glycerol phosphate synthase subunit HisH [Candidatus Dormibacteraeota bacterium]|nr:imidazole glycerol phosphate synthase subunit HisH [Candidatus Dormibacteraeota bacterium]